MNSDPHPHVTELLHRTIPSSNTTQSVPSRRSGSDPANDGGIVADFSWLTNNEGAYDAFHSTTSGTSFFAANAGGWIVGSSHSIASCAAFSDGEGVLDNGLLTVGWNGKAFEWMEPGEEGAVYAACAAKVCVGGWW